MALSDSHGYANITTIHLKNFFHLPKVKSVTIKWSLSTVSSPQCLTATILLSLSIRFYYSKCLM